jgi:hypothetical protein
MADVATVHLQAAKGEARTYIGTQHASGDPLAAVTDISGWTIVLTVRRQTSGQILLQKTASLLSPTVGTYQFVVNATETRHAVGAYPLDIWRTDPGSERQIGFGTWTISPVVKHG